MSKIQGHVYLKRWSPKIAARAARQRLRKVELLLQEIADLYGDVYQPVVTDCDSVTDQLEGLRESIQEAEDQAVTL